MKVLVASASRHEATSGIAAAIADALRGAGLEVDDRDLLEVHDLEPYDAVILGSAVYAGEWLPAANEFVQRFEAALRRKPIWLFSSGPIGDPPLPTEEPKAVDRLMARLQPRGHETFAGRLEREHLGFLERSIARVMHAPFGDYRDWPAIRAWARSIALELAAPRPVPSRD